MEPSFWIERWNAGKIAFHEGRPNVYLERHADRLGPASRVLVPLCGKSEDLAYLAGRGHAIVGVELVEDAARAFFAEHGATPEVTPCGAFTAYAAGSITILVGDMFAATGDVLGSVDALYDRAALVALPSALRTQYMDHLRKVMPSGSPGLVVTFEYDQARMAGPPFSVTEEELRELYRGLTVERLTEDPSANPRFVEAGVDVLDRCYFVRY